MRVRGVWTQTEIRQMTVTKESGGRGAQVLTPLIHSKILPLDLERRLGVKAQNGLGLSVLSTMRSLGRT
jgi:hypothetical protein